MSQLHGNKKKIIGFVVLGVLALTVLVLATVRLMSELKVMAAVREINNELGLNIGKNEILSFKESDESIFVTGYDIKLQLKPNDIKLMRENVNPYVRCKDAPTKTECQNAEWTKQSPDTSTLPLAQLRFLDKNIYCSTLEYTVNSARSGRYYLCVGVGKSTATFIKDEITTGV